LKKIAFHYNGSGANAQAARRLRLCSSWRHGIFLVGKQLFPWVLVVA